MKSLRALKRRTNKRLDDQLPVPSEDKIATLSALLEKQIRREEIRRRYAPVKHILTLIGVTGVVGLSLVAPSAAQLAKPFVNQERNKRFDEWKRYNPSYLRSSLKRLHNMKCVEITEKDGDEIITLTEGGKRRILKYALDDLSIEKPKTWDGRWRMIVYDVDERKKRLRDVFREALQSLGFLQLQQSVWLCPYPCEKQITFLKEYYDVGNEVLYIVATTLEDDSPYRDYFGLA